MDERSTHHRSQQAMDEELADVLMAISVVARRLAKKLMLASANERKNTRDEESHARQRRDDGPHHRGHDYPAYRF
ncbi:MAG: hypothetical protein CVV52_18295 [Spirochaetae bacterium HGW-Spirochaetae-8]|jgi:NTP pyrophosphatase (non-canonical NTP hydrolase)|nr:MAG: hypothetical protein CVV52_18295 [Spirochaetae bacterium HGW-Spirochaetae-8]